MKLAIVVVALALCFYVWVRWLHAVALAGSSRYQIRDLLILIAAMALLASVGYAVDSVVVCALIAYSVAVGPLWFKLARVWTQRKIVLAASTGAAVASSFALVATIGSILAYAIWPTAFKVSTAVYLAIYSSIYVGFMYILGDNATSELQLILYGLPVGLLVNVVVAAVVGGALGLAVGAKAESANTGH